MSDIHDHRESLGQVEFPNEVKEALGAVTEFPDDLEAQADFFDKIQSALATRLSDDS